MQLHRFSQRVRSIIALFCVVAPGFLANAVHGKDCLVYFGTFTDAGSKGIYVSRLDMDTGKLSAPELAAISSSPNFLTVSPNGRVLYAAVRGGIQSGSISAYAINNHSGKLKLLDQKSSGGSEPCYVGLDATGQNLFAANYDGGTVKSFHINPDGTLKDGTEIAHHGHSINPDRQAGPHPHCFVAAPGGRFALACDLGLDKVLIYRVNPANAALEHNKPPFASIAPGSGPRHLVFNPDGKTASVISEMACTVTVFDWDGVKGILHARQTVPILPNGVYQKTFTAAEIAYRPDGRFLYATVRGPDAPGPNCISVFAVDPQTGNLSLVQNLPSGGIFPRGMGIDPSDNWLIIGNQKSGTITVFRIDADSGKLAPTGKVLSVASAVDVKFAPAD